MKIRLFSVLALAGLLFCGCAVEDTPVVEGGTILAEMENDKTRTSVTDEGSFTWSSGDKVWLQTTNGSVVGTLSSGAGTSRASFSTGVFIGELTGKAVYPYNASHSISGDELSFVLPASYDLGSNLANTNAAMYGVVNSKGILKFRHLAGVMRFKFKGVPAGVNKFTITLDKKINGTFAADLTADYPVIETSSASAASEKTITLNFNELTKASDMCLYVPLPVGTYNSLELGLYDDEQSVWTYSSDVTNTISRKTLKLMPTVTLGGSIGGEIEGDDNSSATTVINLSEAGTANSYIVSSAGSYKFSTVKGNSSTSVGIVSKAEVLWESFGTDVTPNVGDLVKNAVYTDGCITFQTAETFKEGNAVIAAKDASGNILWSWHIWLTDQPEEQVYKNNAGTMMDRNLGATSATPGDVGALGLLYQWGRKDPFLGSSSISSNTIAKSTITWPSAVSTSSSTGTVDYVTSHPTTFVTGVSSSDYDWCYSSRDSLWTISHQTKSIYDPCPVGWRVPDGGSNGVWAKAGFDDTTYDSTNEGMSFGISSPSTTWYPASGHRYDDDGSLSGVGDGGYWSASPNGGCAYNLSFNNHRSVGPSTYSNRAFGSSVRCVKEGTGGGSSDSDSNVHKETVRFESVTYDWTLQRALDLRGDNNEPYAKPIINNVRYDNIYNLEYFLRPDSEYQITKTVKCGDHIVDPSVITFQNITPPTVARAGSADIVLSGYEFGDTENTYSFEILASNDDLELIITGSITLGALPETVEIEREVALMLVPGTTQFEGVEALVADAYEELGVENAGFNEANLAKVNDVMLAVLMDPENVVTNVPDYLTNLNFRVDANVDNSFVRLYNHQVANNILNPDGYVFERTIDTWFGVDFVYTITAKPELPENYLIPSEVRMTTDENDVKYVKVLGQINSEGVYTIHLVDLCQYFNVASEIENNLKVKFDILRGDVLLSANEVEVNALGELENIKAVLDWDQYAGTVVDVKASLLAENTYILDELDFQLRTKDPLTFEFGDIVRVTRVPGMSASAKVYENVVLKSSVEPSVENLVDQEATSIMEIFAKSHADKTYGIDTEVRIWGVYVDEAMTVPYSTQKWAADNLNGTITLFADDGQLLYPIYAKATLSFTHNIHDACTAKKDIIIIFV
ncbi:MAG: hypothetical protein J6R30_01725 [Bacteroidales bacterium]|nr:hypothetical protein [Bacteroidales bacterium]